MILYWAPRVGYPAKKGTIRETTDLSSFPPIGPSPTTPCLSPSGATTTTTHFNEAFIPHEFQDLADCLLADTRAISFQF